MDVTRQYFNLMMEELRSEDDKLKKDQPQPLFNLDQPRQEDRPEQ